MRVQKTFRHGGRTIEHGTFKVRETVWECAAKCRHPSGALITRRADSVIRCIMPDSVVGYDVMVFVGIERCCHKRQREEISVLLNERGICLSTGEISTLAKRFLNYLRALHIKRTPQLRQALALDGGWPLHVDATGEDGRGTLLVAYAGWRRWVLGAWKVPTERSEVIVPHLRSVVAQFGAPCAVMRDLGRGVTKAINDLIEELDLEIPVLACHLHFLRDIGKDLLDSDHGKLRALFRRFKIRPGLHALARDLGCKLGGDISQARDGLKSWQEHDGGGHDLPGGRAGIAVVRSMAQWVLDYATDGQYQDYPFDRPYLDLYNRCVVVNRALDAFVRNPPNDSKIQKALQRLRRVLVPVESEVPFSQVSKRLRQRCELFDELRDALRLYPRESGRTHPVSLRFEQTAGELRDIQERVENMYISLENRRPERGPGQNKREAIDLVMEHLLEHHEYLWGHDITLPADVGGGIRMVERTNNLLESFFRNMKHGERRRSGRKILTQDFERMPPEMALACNLNRPDYVGILCGSLDRLAEAFVELDAENRRKNMSGSQVSQSVVAPRPVIASASLPAEDRKIIRSEAMKRRVLSAARSRAPRNAVKRLGRRKATVK